MISISILREMMAINELAKEEEGECVTIFAANPEAMSSDENYAIEVFRSWTGWKNVRFYGPTVLDCLEDAVKTKNSGN